MANPALLVTIEARSGKEAEVEVLVRGALSLARAEAGTRSWHVFQSGPSTFGMFAVFEDETARRAHLDGEIATRLLGCTEALLARPPQVASVDLLAAK